MRRLPDNVMFSRMSESSLHDGGRLNHEEWKHADLRIGRPSQRLTLPGLFIVGTVLLTCLNQGMFFKGSFLSLGLMSVWFLSALIVTISQLWRSRTSVMPRFSRLERSSILQLWIVTGPFAIAALYSLHLLLSNRLSIQATLVSTLEWLFYALLGLSLYRLNQTERGRWMIGLSYSIVIWLLTLSALASIYGLLPIPHAILHTGDSEISATGARLGGLLQYPNTFGAVMAALLMERLLFTVRRSGSDFTRVAGWRGYWNGAQVLLLSLCLLLAESRGAYMAGAVGWAAGWLLLRGAERSRYVQLSGVSLAAAALLARQLSAAQLAPSPLPGLLLLAAVMAAALALSGRALRGGRAQSPAAAGAAGKSARAGIKALWITGLGLTLALPLLLARGLRFATLSARWSMYADAWKLFLRSPWIGQGGDSWKLAFRSTQSQPYVGSEVHSGFIDFALDLGLAGLLILCLWLGALAWRLLHTRRLLLPPFIILTLHSIIDFDMSYGLFWVLILMLTTATITPLPSCEPGQFQHRKAISAPVPESVAVNRLRLPVRRSSHLIRPASRLAVTALLAVLMLTASLTGLRLAAGQLLLARAEATAGPAQALLLQRSLAASPANTAARLALAARSLPHQAALLLQQGLHYERENPELLAALGRATAQRGDLTALSALQRAVALDRFNRAVQTEALQEIYQLARVLREDKRTMEARMAAATGYALYRDYASLAEQAASHPAWRNDRQFRLTLAARIRGQELYEFAAD
ncbi:O-antigen ligase family protein [Paenibacillus aceti]|uniref:O-antigen ligase family protein n=1 Tax=Paenibacillus aceti TaxID=1820010 RepID=UPI000EA02AC8|nr:O-antigen ligase family protein [Paenibacillus aceti]